MRTGNIKVSFEFFAQVVGVGVGVGQRYRVPVFLAILSQSTVFIIMLFHIDLLCCCALLSPPLLYLSSTGIISICIFHDVTLASWLFLSHSILPMNTTVPTCIFL